MGSLIMGGKTLICHVSERMSTDLDDFSRLVQIIRYCRPKDCCRRYQSLHDTCDGEIPAEEPSMMRSTCLANPK